MKITTKPRPRGSIIMLEKVEPLEQCEVFKALMFRFGYYKRNKS